MKRTALEIGFFVLLGVIILPLALVEADVQTITCATTGYTVVFVNGILDTLDQARVDKNQLKAAFDRQDSSHFNNENVDFELGYNPTHLAGAGDLAETLAQMHGSSLSDYDLNTILMQIY